MAGVSQEAKSIRAAFPNTVPLEGFQARKEAGIAEASKRRRRFFWSRSILAID